MQTGSDTVPKVLALGKKMENPSIFRDHRGPVAQLFDFTDITYSLAAQSAAHRQHHEGTVKNAEIQTLLHTW